MNKVVARDTSARKRGVGQDRSELTFGAKCRVAGLVSITAQCSHRRSRRKARILRGSLTMEGAGHTREAEGNLG